MKIEDKELLLKDLSARFPFGVKGKLISNDSPNNIVKLIEIFICNEEIECRFSLLEENEEILFNYEGYEYRYYLSEFRPYLFPLTSMTEEQEEIICLKLGDKYPEANCLIASDGNYILFDDLITGFEIKSCYEIIEFLNTNHFDYRGLIEKGLAIDATGLNIYK